MVKHSEKRPRRVFALGQLRAVHLEEISRWVGMEFRNAYRPPWHNGDVDHRVMTANQRPIFMFSVLSLDPPPGAGPRRGKEGHLYLLYSPRIYRSEHLLSLAWQAVTVYGFLQSGLSRVQTAIDANDLKENRILTGLGYRCMESISEASGRMNLYTCSRKEFRVSM
jgi:hypothetical protein